MTGQEIQTLICDQLQRVLALDGPPAPADRLEADLHADSLDLVEVIESVEADLDARGIQVHLPEDDLRRLRTVADAVAAVTAAIGGSR